MPSMSVCRSKRTFSPSAKNVKPDAALNGAVNVKNNAPTGSCRDLTS